MRLEGNAQGGADEPSPVVIFIDERGSLCPQPIIALGRAARDGPAGRVVHLLADDVAARVDVPAWCRMRGAQLLAVTEEAEGGQRYTVRLGAGTN